MDLKKFNKQKKLSKDGEFYYVKEDNKLFINTTRKMKRFKLPASMADMVDLAIWEIGPEGKKLHINNMEVTP